MNRLLSRLIFSALAVVLALGVSARAQLPAEMQESTVRILCPLPAKDAPNGFLVDRIKLSDGTIFGMVPSSFGTGFVINNEGYIVTNNHVVAPDPEVEEPCKLVLVMQKVGKHYLLHKAKVLWQSANRDVAVIQCPHLKAPPLPLLFDETKSTASEEVYSMGFPGVTDVAEENFSRSREIRQQLIIGQAQEAIEALQQKLRRRLTQKEIDAVVGAVAEQQGPVSADRNDLMAALDGYLRQADAAPGFWDVTSVLDRKTLWRDYFTPTVTKGNIERITKRHGVLGVTYPDIMTIQHSCAIKHGNSGGPLFNAGGQVIGIVGRGNTRPAGGEVESVAWATAISEVKDWLDTNRVAYILPKEWRKSQVPVKIIVAVAVAVAVAIVALVLGIMKFNQKPSFTTILRDPRMAKVLGTTQSKLIDVAKDMSHKTYVAPLPGFGKWQLAGRTPQGDSVRIEVSDVMFSSNNNRLILGRAAELCHVVVNDTSVSKQHACIRKDGDRFLVSDRNSSNRTAVNGQFNTKAFDEVPLKEGDTLTLGEVRLDFSKL